MFNPHPTDLPFVRRPRPRGRRRWYLLFALVALALSLGMIGAVAIRAATGPRSVGEILAPTDPTVPVHAVTMPDQAAPARERR